MAAKKKITASVIVEKYMHHLLEHGEHPKSVYLFSKEIGIKESEFYQFYASFEAIESSIFVYFFDNAIEVLEQNEEYHTFEPKNKLLSFYYTFFEVLTANRSFVMHVLKDEHNKLKALKKLKPLKAVYKEYVDQLEIQPMEINFERAEEAMQRSVSEISWAQLLFTLKYWMNDTSKSFEKTDVLIEKSMNTGFELLNTKPLESIIDLGKFLFKDLVGAKARK